MAGRTDEMLTIAELAELLKLAPKTIYEWRHRGEGPKAYKFHGQVRYWRSDVEEWLEAQNTDGRRAV